MPESQPDQSWAESQSRETKTILVAARDDHFSATVREKLAQAGYDVISVCDGNECLIAADRLRPDLLLVDMQMPKRSGFLVVEKLRQSHFPPIKIIMCALFDGKRHRGYAESLGVDDFIARPCSVTRVIDRVNRLIGCVRPVNSTP